MRIRTALLALFVAAACTPKSGEDEDSGDTGATAAETGTPPTGGAMGGLGTACTHNGQLGFEGVRLTPFDPVCGDALCVYADSAKGSPDPCMDDLECNQADPSRQRFVCDEGECVVSDAYIRERSMCAASCAADSDCVGADPATTCQIGFVCLIISSSCCTPMCVCEDDLSAGSADLALKECAMQPEPGCEF